MKLYLVQHGLAFSKEQDPERRLTPEGIEILRKLGNFTSDIITEPLYRIYHSGKHRAKQTAEIYAEFFHPTDGLHLGECLNPMDDPQIWYQKLLVMDQDIMIVGHLPFLEGLLELLIPENEDQDDPDAISPVKFQNGGIIIIEKYGEKKFVVDLEIFPN